MDKNTVIGLSLIGVLLVTFTYLNQPSQEELAKKAKTEKALKEKATAQEKVANKVVKSTEANTGNDTPTVVIPTVKEEIITLESDKIIFTVSTKGGVVNTVQLKEFESYKNFVKKKKNKKPLYLFKEGDQKNELPFNAKANSFF